jgi:hypothetical protein
LYHPCIKRIVFRIAFAEILSAVRVLAERQKLDFSTKVFGRQVPIHLSRDTRIGVPKYALNGPRLGRRQPLCVSPLSERQEAIRAALVANAARLHAGGRNQFPVATANVQGGTVSPLDWI